MSIEKQIEELAKDIDEVIEFTVLGIYDGFIKVRVACERLAEKIYNAGYRKQSEGEWVDRYNGRYANPIYECSECGKVPLKKMHINELNNMELVDALSSFCPHCGAKMKGGASDGGQQ